MSVAQRVFRHAKDLTDLESLAKLVADLPSISEAAKLAREEAAMTQEEIDKVNEAKAFIVKYEELSHSIAGQTNSLLAAKNAQEKIVSEFTDFQTAENKRLSDFTQELNDKAAAQAETEKSHAIEWQKIAGERKKMADEHQNAMNEAKARESEAQKAKDAANAAESRFNGLTAELQQKAAKVREAANF